MDPSDDAARVCLVTAPDEETAKRIARALVERRLVACVNIVPGLTSVYHWAGALQEDSEVLLICKTIVARLEAIEAALRELHPYDVFEFVALLPDHVEASYLDWMRVETRSVN